MRRTMTARFWILPTAATALISLAPCARAQNDACRDVLVNRLANVTVQQQDAAGAEAKHHAQCLRTTSGGTSGGSAGVSYGGVGVDLSQNSSNQNSSSNCGSEDASAHQSAAIFYGQQSFSEAISAWSACMISRHEFACWAVPVGEPTVVNIIAQWNPQTPRPTVNDSTLIVGGTKLQKPAPPHSQLFAGDNLFTVQRQANQSITFTLSVSADDFGQRSCVVWIPKVPVPPSHPTKEYSNDFRCRMLLTNGPTPPN